MLPVAEDGLGRLRVTTTLQRDWKVGRSPQFRRNVRLIAYWWHTWFTWRIFCSLQSVLTHCVIIRSSFGSRVFNGVRLIAYPPHDLVTLNEVVEALELIQRIDPHRCRRVERHIQYIVLANWSPKRYAAYLARTKECRLRKLPVPENARFVKLLCMKLRTAFYTAKGFRIAKQLSNGSKIYARRRRCAFC